MSSGSLGPTRQVNGTTGKEQITMQAGLVYTEEFVIKFSKYLV